MEKILMFVLLFGVVAVMGQNEGTCEIDAQTRYDCGWLGIDEATCSARDCCWDDTVSGGTPYCFFKGGIYYDGLCPVAPSERVECGQYGTTKEECLGKSCCWDESVPDAKWCFQQPEGEAMSCYLGYGISGTCKYVCNSGDDKNVQHARLWGTYLLLPKLLRE
ncbi:P or trefoil or TFF domain [Desmophyllum pertusum]|uniref:P or trefoil or TFF domain n=1 Tax=Desmophyllum pertusum TaxID=174260 RepID=A0A9W9YI01_9CNID|nr:P or trefoil or TFF domain [Desmophyllum pertusum]